MAGMYKMVRFAIVANLALLMETVTAITLPAGKCKHLNTTLLPLDFNDVSCTTHVLANFKVSIMNKKYVTLYLIYNTCCVRLNSESLVERIKYERVCLC